VYSHKKKKEKLEYMHANPVVRGVRDSIRAMALEQFFILCKRGSRIAEIDFINL